MTATRRRRGADTQRYAEFEVEGKGPFVWTAYSGHRILIRRKVRTRLGLLLSVWFHYTRLRLWH